MFRFVNTTSSVNINMLMLYLSFYSKKSELEMLKYLLLERYQAQGSSSATATDVFNISKLFIENF